MDLYYKQEITVGLLVLAAIGVLVGGGMWLSGRSIGGGRSVLVPVLFTDVSGLREGDPVQISGVRVGRVARVDLEGVDSVMVYLEVGRRRPPHVDARAEVQSLDFFGAKFVEYDPGNSDLMLADGPGLIRGRMQMSVTDPRIAADLTDRAAAVLMGMQNVLSPTTTAEVHETLRSAQRALDAIAQLGTGPAAREATTALSRIAVTAARIDSLVGSSDVRESVAQLDELTESLTEMAEGLATATQALGSLLEKMDSGEGTLGRLVTDTLIYNDMHEVLQSIKELLEDMRERPGRYFHVSVF